MMQSRALIMEKKGYGSITKSKYSEFDIAIRHYLNGVKDMDADKIAIDILAILSDVTLFDPNVSSYKKDLIEKRRQKSGKTTYELLNRKYYETHKDEMDKKIVSDTRIRRAAKKLQELGLTDNAIS
jgi:hypothetical protein